MELVCGYAVINQREKRKKLKKGLLLCRCFVFAAFLVRLVVLVGMTECR